MLHHDEFDDTGIFDDIDVELNHFQEIYPNLSNSESSNYYNLETFNKLPGKNKNDLSIFYQNIRSLNSNYNNVSHLSLSEVNSVIDARSTDGVVNFIPSRIDGSSISVSMPRLPSTP